jgi:hypothetical protein
LAPGVGIEPTTNWLTANCTTAVLSWNLSFTTRALSRSDARLVVSSSKEGGNSEDSSEGNCHNVYKLYMPYFTMSSIFLIFLEHRVGFAPTNNCFADSSITTLASMLWWKIKDSNLCADFSTIRLANGVNKPL